MNTVPKCFTIRSPLFFNSYWRGRKKRHTKTASVFLAYLRTPESSNSPPREEGWLRHQRNFGEVHLSAADGVVAHKPCFRRERAPRPLRVHPSSREGESLECPGGSAYNFEPC